MATSAVSAVPVAAAALVATVAVMAVVMAAAAITRIAVAATKQKKASSFKGRGFSCIFWFQVSTLSVNRKYRTWEEFHE